MARVSVLAKLDAENKKQLDKKLREEGYGNYDDIFEWLRLSGIETSRSALHRYGMNLKARDRVTSQLVGHLTLDDAGTESRKREATEILMELGALRVREAGLIEQLRVLGITG